MQNNPLKRKFSPSRVLVIAVGLIALIAMTPNKMIYHAAPWSSNSRNADEKIYKIVSGKQIAKLLKYSKGENIIMNIYPVKRSSKADQNDFDLEVVFLKQGEIFSPKTADFNMKQFKQQAGWYIRYLKKNNIPKEDIPYGYYLTLSPDKLKDMVGIGISLEPEKNKLEHFFIMTSNSDYLKKSKKDSCPCDPKPVPMPVTLAAADTGVGRCPPSCPPKALVYSNEMQKIIDIQYKMN